MLVDILGKKDLKSKDSKDVGALFDADILKKGYSQYKARPQPSPWSPGQHGLPAAVQGKHLVVSDERDSANLRQTARHLPAPRRPVRQATQWQLTAGKAV
jgi:hypothetical protein